MTTLYPFLLESQMVARPWGGHALADLFNKPVTGDQPIGESWEAYPKSVITNGELAGITVQEAFDRFGARITPDDHGEFPLLIKFLDAREWLSVQVHPDDEQARQLENQPRGKTECWYILDAAPGAQLAYGVREELTVEQFRQMIADGHANQLMANIPVKAGDFVYVPAGTPHAIGPGIVLYELQQMSDVTYRVYDWDRVGLDGKPRELHLEKALKVMTLHPRPVITVAPPEITGSQGNMVSRLTRAAYFGLDRLRVIKPTVEYSLEGTCNLLTVINGTIMVNDVTVGKGQTVLIPAGLAHFTLSLPARTTEAEVLRAWPTIRE